MKMRERGERVGACVCVTGTHCVYSVQHLTQSKDAWSLAKVHTQRIISLLFPTPALLPTAQRLIDTPSGLSIQPSQRPGNALHPTLVPALHFACISV